MSACNVERLAEISGYSSRQLERFIKDGVFKRVDGLIDPVEALAAILRRLREKGGEGDLASEKLAKLKAERQLKEVELETARRELVPIDDLRKLLTGIRAAAKAKLIFYLLNQAPQRNDGMAAGVQRENNQRILEEVLTAWADAEEAFLKQ
jgi:hypothetical protein